MTKVAVLVVHGIGWSDDGRTRDPVDRALTRLMDPPRGCKLLEDALAKEGIEVPYAVKLAYWGKEIQPVQTEFERRYKDLRWHGARHVVISALGDASQYQAAVYAKGAQTFPTYETIHSVVAKELAKLATECGVDAPLVVVGHSLGAHILSNHIYDEQSDSRPTRGETPLARMETLRGIATLGCNIPLFVMGTQAPKPIELRRAKWVNYYDPDDVLAYPLRPLYFPNGEREEYPLEDVKVEVGGPILGRTPVSHGYYWDHAVVARGIAKLIRDAAR